MSAEARAIAAFKETECYRKIAEVCKSFNEDMIGNVGAKDAIIEIAYKYGWGNDVEYNCKELGALPENRDWEGCSYHRAHTRLQVIMKGWCSLQTLRASLIVREENPHKKTSAIYTASLQHKSKCYARYKEHEIRAGCYGATHCVHGFACAHDGVESSIAEMTSMGKLDATKIIGNDKALHHCIYGKLEVRQLRWEIHEALPVSTKIIVGALNTVMQVGEGESWMQNLRKLAQEASVYINRKVDMDTCQKNVLKTQPPRAADVPAMGRYLVQWGGLPSGVHVNDVCDGLAHFMPTERIVVGSFFDELAKLKFPVDSMPSHLVNAFLFTHAAKEHGVTDNIARYISKPDISQLVNPKNKKLVEEADLCLQRSKKLIQQHADKISIEKQQTLLGNYKMDIVDLVADKNKEKTPKAKSSKVDKEKNRVSKSPKSSSRVLWKLLALLQW